MTSSKQQYAVFFGYPGHPFHGVAPQPHVHTAGAALWARLATLTHTPPHAVSFAARTDAGVSANHNLVTFRLPKDIPAEAVIQALQTQHPDHLSQVTAQTISRRVMARCMAEQKHYCYRIAGPAAVNAEPGNAAVWRVACPIHIQRLRRALSQFAGRHNFQNFCHAARPAGDPSRTIYKIDVDADVNGETGYTTNFSVAIHIHGDGFFRRMIRMIVFTAIEAAAGLRAINQIPKLLHPTCATDKTHTRNSAPARGLTLERLQLTPEAQTLLCPQTSKAHRSQKKLPAAGKKHPNHSAHKPPKPIEAKRNCPPQGRSTQTPLPTNRPSPSEHQK